MDIKESEEASRQRKFGLPGWMVNNIERLNFVTDFEQYACSPPETESFLAEYEQQQLASSMPPPNNIETAPTAVDLKEVGAIDVPRSRPPKLNLDMQLSRNFGNNCMKSDELLYSSPDSTPCATPEPSPVVRRKVSIPQPHDTVITNPGGWFYLGKLKRSDGNKENQTLDKCPNSKNSSIKLMISNFDLNAVSPTSW